MKFYEVIMRKVSKKVILIILAMISIVSIFVATLLITNNKDKNDDNRDSKIKKQLSLQNTYEDVEELYDKVESLDNFVDICQGDIGNDKTNDVVVICERIDQTPPEDYVFWDEQRIICVYTETEKGQYVLKYTNGHLISEEGSGGMVGDPHQGMEIKNGVLKVRELKGSSEKWGRETYWGYVDGEFVLCKYIRFDYHAHTGNGEEAVYDFTTGNVEKYALASEPLLVYKGTFKHDKVKFGDKFRMDNIEISPKEYLPSINIAGIYDYYGKNEDVAYIRNSSINRGAIEALDAVKERDYPEMKKVQMDFDEEIYKNIEYLRSYEIPRYYYESDDGDVLYFASVIVEDGKLVYNMQHSTDDIVKWSDIDEKTENSSIKETEESANNLTDEDFVIKNEDTYVKLRGKFDEMKVGDKLVSHRPVSEKRAYEVYYYENLTISVGIDVFSIVLITSKFETARGIKVGDSMDKVFEKYGVTEKDDEYEDYTYYGPDRYKLIFEVDKNDIITRIKLEPPV